MKTLPLTKGAVAIVDDSDFEAVSKSKWCLSSHGYAVRHLPRSGKCGKVQYLHRFLLPDAKEVDHRDGNRLNNRRDNLRGCSHLENTRGAHYGRKNGSSQYRGVNREKDKWAASIRLNGKKKFLGYFGVEEDAARAYDTAAKQHFGEFASPNFKTI